jgi:hypothetical protein
MSEEQWVIVPVESRITAAQVDQIDSVSDLLHVSPDPCESAFVDERHDLIVSHHSEFIYLFFARNNLSFPTDGAKLLEQFSVRWRVDLWFAVFFIICKKEQTMRQRGGLPTSPLRCLSQWAILKSIESREFSIFSAYIHNVFCTWDRSLFIST